MGDPFTQSVSLIGDFGDAPHKWDPGCLGPDGRLYFAPANAREILVIDPLSHSYALIGDFGAGEYKWNRGVCGIDGVMYFAPWNASAVLVIDPLPQWSPAAHLS